VKHTRILIDVDGVIANFVDAFLEIYEEMGGAMDRLPNQEIREAVWDFPDLFWRPKPYPGTIEALEEMNDRFDVRIVTAIPHKHIEARSDWFRYYAPFIHRKNQMIFTNDKSLIRGDIFIDDYLPHAEAWFSVNYKPTVIIDRAWNRDGGSTFFHRVDELADVADAIGLDMGE